jgi:hypothetical protein
LPFEHVTRHRTMNVEERGNVLTARATPGCVWIFGFWFVAGGVLAMVMTFAASNASDLVWWERLFTFSIGVGCAAAGLFVILGAPAIRAVFDRTSGRAIVTTTGLRERSRVEFACRDVCVVDLAEEKDSDGEPMYRVRLWLRDGRVILLQSQPVHGLEWCARRADVIRRFLGIRPPRATVRR